MLFFKRTCCYYRKPPESLVLHVLAISTPVFHPRDVRDFFLPESFLLKFCEILLAAVNSLAPHTATNWTYKSFLGHRQTHEHILGRFSRFVGIYGALRQAGHYQIQSRDGQKRNNSRNTWQTCVKELFF